jgi:ribose 1,5-bisphosphokinase PhnN
MSVGLLVVVNGSSGSGKSWLIGRVQQRARDLAVLDGLRCATRATTRAQRDTESLPNENRYLEPIAFDDEADSGMLDVHWRRMIHTDHEVRYGFAVDAELADGGIVVLSANNYLDWPAQPLLASLREQGRLMVVRVWASRETRRERLRARQPELNAPELASRLDDVSAQELPPADHVVPNDPPFEAHAEWDLLRWLASVRLTALPGMSGERRARVPEGAA